MFPSKKQVSIFQLCFFQMLRENLRGAQDRTGSVDQSGSLESQQRAHVGGVLH